MTASPTSIAELVRTRDAIASIRPPRRRVDDTDHIVSFANGSFRYPRNVVCDGKLQPDVWIERTHAATGVHEPGLIAWMAALGAHQPPGPLTFIDCGALFGYFSVFAAHVFRDVSIIAVEANPPHARALQAALAAGIDNSAAIDVVNAILDTSATPAKRVIFRGFEVHEHVAWRQLATARARNVRKAVRSRVLRSSRSPAAFRRTPVPCIALSDLVASVPRDSALVVKIDVEGAQAAFLPGAVDELCERSAVVLLEFDDLAKFERFGRTTNFALCEPFLAAGYRLLWCDHRVPGSKVREVVDRDSTIETNSLAALVPGPGW